MASGQHLRAGQLTVAILQFGPSMLDKAPDVGERFVTAYLRGARYYDEALARPDGKAEIAPILMKYTPLKDRSIYDRISFFLRAARRRDQRRGIASDGNLLRDA